MKTFLLPIELEQEEAGRWSAACPILPGCNTWGNTRDEAVTHLQDAIRLYIEDVQASGDTIPPGTLRRMCRDAGWHEDDLNQLGLLK